MSGRGGCCIARHAGGGGGGGGGFTPYGMSKVERIMLKFRPIAPKPVAAGSGSGGSTTENSDGYVKCGRGKRKYVRVNRNNNKKKMVKKEDKNIRKVSPPCSSSPPLEGSGGDAVVTLSLLPETPDRKESSPATSLPDLNRSGKCSSNNNNMKISASPVWLSFNGHVDDPVVMAAPPPPRRRMVSEVTVECVTDTWTGVEGLGCTDEERVMKMEVDTCPGFISDGQDRVVWANNAYKKMVGVNGGESMTVVLVRKDKWISPPLTAVTYPAFTCKVKVSSAVNGGTPSPSSPTTLTLPCDGWRMKSGGCAWRLDVKAALSLGR